MELLGVVRAALGEPGFVTGLDPEGASTERARANGTPLLDGQRIAVDAARVGELFERLRQALGEGHPEPGVAVELLAAIIRHDSETTKRLAGSLGLEAEKLEALGGFLAVPVLSEGAQARSSDIPSGWGRGYCPICGAWPALAEFRGLDRARLLRCGRCGCAWPMVWLRCVYCGENDHGKLGSLVPEGAGEQLRVETCDSCRGYLKGVTSLQESPLPELLLRDLETVELDLVALDRGYARPPGPGHALDVSVIASPKAGTDS